MRFSILSFCCVIAFPSHWSRKISRTANVRACTRLKTLHSCCLTPICSYPSTPQSDLQLPTCIFIPQSTGPPKGMLREFLHWAVPAGRPGPLLGQPPPCQAGTYGWDLSVPTLWVLSPWENESLPLSYALWMTAKPCFLCLNVMKTSNTFSFDLHPLFQDSTSWS